MDPTGSEGPLQTKNATSAQDEEVEKQCEPTTSDGFPLFNKFPAELQFLVWVHAVRPLLPAIQPFHLNQRPWNLIHNRVIPHRQNGSLWATTTESRRAISEVFLSVGVARRKYKMATNAIKQKARAPHRWAFQPLQPSRDLILLTPNWELGYENDMKPIQAETSTQLWRVAIDFWPGWAANMEKMTYAELLYEQSARGFFVRLLRQMMQQADTAPQELWLIDRSVRRSANAPKPEGWNLVTSLPRRPGEKPLGFYEDTELTVVTGVETEEGAKTKKEKQSRTLVQTEYADLDFSVGMAHMYERSAFGFLSALMAMASTLLSEEDHSIWQVISPPAPNANAAAARSIVQRRVAILCYL